MPSPFDSAWLKWARGVVHANVLQGEVFAFAQTEANRREAVVGTRHYDPRRHGFAVDVLAVPTTPVSWGLILGDVLSNLRSALEHAAWAVVRRGEGGCDGFPLAKKEASGVYFPVVSISSKQFSGDARTKLIGARRADVAFIRKFQPYHLKRKIPYHPLAILNDIANKDKHRNVKPILMTPTKGSYVIVNMSQCEPTRDAREPAPRKILLEPGAELGVVRVRKTGPHPQIYVKPSLTITPSITMEARLDDFLTHTTGMIRAILLGLGSEPPDEIVQLGDPSLFFPPGEIPPNLRP